MTDSQGSLFRYFARQENEPLPPLHLIKIGQWPSLADFQLGELKQFDEGMTSSQRSEYVRAIQCSAHGFHVAACVHFRRVFESVLAEARLQYMTANTLKDWPEFDVARTDHRIRLLRDNMPKFMSEHPHLYGILSVAVHELTEDQCAKELLLLERAIRLIVYDRVTQARIRTERAEVSRLLAQSVDAHMNPQQTSKEGNGGDKVTC